MTQDEAEIVAKMLGGVAYEGAVYQLTPDSEMGCQRCAFFIPSSDCSVRTLRMRGHEFLGCSSAAINGRFGSMFPFHSKQWIKIWPTPTSSE